MEDEQSLYANYAVNSVHRRRVRGWWTSGWRVGLLHSFIHSFIHSGHFYSAPSSPLPLRSAPDYSTGSSYFTERITSDFVTRTHYVRLRDTTSLTGSPPVYAIAYTMNFCGAISR